MGSDNNSVLVPSIFGFASTSVDDFMVMLIYFAQAQLMDNPRAGYYKVIMAQTMAFTLVMIISLLGIVLGVLVPMSYVDLIGILPLLIGIVQCYEACTDKGEVDIISINSGGGGSVNRNSYRALSQSLEDEYMFAVEQPGWFEEENIQLVNDGLNVKPTSPRAESWTDGMFHPFTFEVFIFALVCSCDNIAIYVAMFAAMKTWEVIVMVLLFYVLLGFTIIVSVVIVQVTEFSCEYLIRVVLVKDVVFVSTVWTTRELLCPAFEIRSSNYVHCLRSLHLIT
jgi:cadmium resistance protein CadD (predicted permease)